jgi:hypothetical protein
MTTSAVNPAATAPGTSPSAKPGKHPRRGLARLLAGRLLHGQATVLGKDGKPVQVAEQRGTVEAVSATSITLKSKDGFTQTYTVTPATHVRVDGKKSSIANVKANEQAGVVAKVNGTTQTADLVIERAAKPGTPS